MAEMIVEETRLKEIVDDLVRKHLKSSIDDVEEVRRSPAGTILRLEERVEFIQKNMATQAQVMATQTQVLAIELRIESIEQNMATKAEFMAIQTDVAGLKTQVKTIEQNMATKADLANLRTEFGERIGKLETGQKIMLTVLFTFFSAIIAMLIKLVFFP